MRITGQGQDYGGRGLGPGLYRFRDAKVIRHVGYPDAREALEAWGWRNRRSFSR